MRNGLSAAPSVMAGTVGPRATTERRVLASAASVRHIPEVPEDPDDPIVLPDLVFDDTDTERAARAALTELAEQERRLPGGKPTPSSWCRRPSGSPATTSAV